MTRPPPNEIFKYKDKKSKDMIVYEIRPQYGYTLKDIAEYIGVHYTTVSRGIKKIEREYEKRYYKTRPHNTRVLSTRAN